MDENLTVPMFRKLEMTEKQISNLLQMAKTQDHQTLEQTIVQAVEASDDFMRKYEDEMEHSKSAAVTELAQVQYRYISKLKELKDGKLVQLLVGHEDVTEGEKYESMALQTEFMIDFSNQALNLAVISLCELLLYDNKR